MCWEITFNTEIYNPLSQHPDSSHLDSSQLSLVQFAVYTIPNYPAECLISFKRVKFDFSLY